MKKFGILSLMFLLLVVVVFPSCDDSNDDVTPDPTLEMTATEKEDLLYMREEEKLARDVYNQMYAKYGLNVFKNIAKSEQTHMDKLLVIINKYGFTDPASPEVGVFNNAALQGLYTSLIAKGEISLKEALVVGATIEDVDIFDLDEAADKTTNADLLDAYDKLNCGSRNHMRAFDGQLIANDTTYAAQFITQAEADEIITEDHEQCGQ